MRQSLSELYSTVRKAAVGRGVPHGIAEDLADAVCWLNSLSFDGVTCAVDCLAHWPSDTSAVRLLRDENGLILATENADTAASALFAGPALGDLLQTGAVPNSGFSVSIDVPLLALAAVAQTCARLKRRAWLMIHLQGQAVIADCNEETCQLITVTPQLTITAPPATEVTLWPSQPDQSSGDIGALINHKEFSQRRNRALTKGLEVCDGSLEQLEAWAALTLVPESDRSRETGAGAGLLDND
ncbi:MAG: DUF3726 domain-containing protein [Pseudomonadota bacterium]|nr:DUF3726 domain-containing protein [Pseudomonadota bacterium]